MLARLFSDLAAFSPTLIGTFPLGLQIAGSDIDIACSASDLSLFERELASLVQIPTRVSRLPLSPEAVVATMTIDGLTVELFCQPLPVHAQAGFRHMVIEGRLLVLGGEALRARVREHKLAGMKTEPAFAHVLGLDGDPYAALLALETWTPERLRGLVDRAPHVSPRPSIAPYVGERAALLPLFRLADDSEQQIADYFTQGVVLVASERDVLLGHAQMLPLDAHGPGTWELKSLAVLPSVRAFGLGRALAAAGIDYAQRHGARRVLVSTGGADTSLLRFYQRLGFRLLRIERDVFTPAAGYPPDLWVDGVRLLDRVWLERTFAESAR